MFVGLLVYSSLAHRSQDLASEDDATMAANGDDVKRELKRLDEKFDRLDEKVDRLDERVERVEGKVDELDKSTKVEFEHVREDIQKLGEGYDAGLKSISRQIQALDKKWTAKWSTHDLALKNHARRISTLEQRDRRDQ